MDHVHDLLGIATRKSCPHFLQIGWPLVYKSLRNDSDHLLVNASQFVNLVNNFIHSAFLKSEIFTNDLIKFIKDNYFESQIDRNAKFQKVQSESQELERRLKFGECFERLDNEGSMALNLDQLSQTLANFKDGLYKDNVKIGEFCALLSHLFAKLVCKVGAFQPLRALR